eukprot:SAG22_NODE_6686_length_823_cov_0.889503_1_plen_27_part_01
MGRERTESVAAIAIVFVGVASSMPTLQ